MFMRKKGECYYAVENYRADGKVRQRIVACLGRTPKLDEAIASVTHTVEWMGERGTPWDHAKSFPKWYLKSRRIKRKLGLYGDTFYANHKEFQGPPYREAQKNRAFLAAYNQWCDSRIDAHLKAEHEKKLQYLAKGLAAEKKKLADLWKIVPESERPALEAAVAQKVKAKREQSAAALQRLAALFLGRPVVPETSNTLTSSGTTTQADVVPENRTREHNAGTTDEYYGS